MLCSSASLCDALLIHVYMQGLIQDYQLLVFQEGKSDMFQYSSTIPYVQFRNSREEKSTLGVENPCALHPLNKSLICFAHVVGAYLANGGGGGVAPSGGASSHGASIEGNGAACVGGGGGSLGRLQLKGVLDGLIKRSINEDK